MKIPSNSSSTWTPQRLAQPTVAAPWSQIPPPYQTNGANRQFTDPAPVGNKFYRLRKP